MYSQTIRESTVKYLQATSVYKVGRYTGKTNEHDRSRGLICCCFFVSSTKMQDNDFLRMILCTVYSRREIMYSNYRVIYRCIGVSSLTWCVDVTTYVRVAILALRWAWFLQLFIRVTKFTYKCLLLYWHDQTTLSLLE